MAIDFKQRAALDPLDPDVRTLLDSLQGNILKGHGRDHTVNLFVRFRAPAADTRTALLALLKDKVTSAGKQQREADDARRFGIPGELFCNVFFSASGYRALGFSPAQLARFSPEFSGGMKQSANALGDDPNTWDESFRGDIHMLVLLADDDEGHVLRTARSWLDELARFADVVAVEKGNALRDSNGEGIEHFGYADGRSQPIFMKDDLENEGATDKWSPLEPLRLVLAEDPALPAGSGQFGSFYVFRKLEQNVLGFVARERELADALGLQGADRARAGAMAVGRFRDGTPLVLSQTDGFLPAKENNFRYDGAAQGRCPVHAHIRKTNPRGDIVSLLHVPDEESAERSRRIVRRGIPYGQRAAHPQDPQVVDALPTKDVGLLFACFQADIAHQFAFMQRSWANNKDFVGPDTGKDPIIASPLPPGAPQNWPREWGKEDATVPFTFGQFVTMKGGEYFFAPSLAFLSVLAPPP